MSEKSSEDIKKICLICGCHTKQAINIYEPRNGPNIIELIQAKFKFQPVNEDKYLCYSCNNWLINWHSLQTMNSNSNESGNVGQSSKSRSHINESIPEEEYDDENLKIRGNSGDVAVAAAQDYNDDAGQYHHHDHHNFSNNISKQKRKGYYFSRRNCIKWRRIRKIRRKQKCLRSCTFCGRLLKTYLPLYKLHSLSHKIILKCKTCSRILEWSANYSKILLQEEKRKLKQLNMTTKKYNNNNDNNNDELYFRTNIDFINRNRCQRPLIDGKVVAMLRRLGTTLTRESECYIDDNKFIKKSLSSTLITQNYQIQQNTIKNNNSKLLSYNNKREMEENEILLDFNTAITEVLQPHDLVKYQMTSMNSINTTTDVEFIETENNDDENITKQLSLEAIYKRIPKCVTISVVGGGTIIDNSDNDNVSYNFKG